MSALQKTISTALSQEVAELTAALEEQRATTERLARALRSEQRKRENVQQKNNRLLTEVVSLQAKLQVALLKRFRTGATLVAMRTTLLEERRAAAHHFRARAELEGQHKVLQESAELLHAHAANTALQLARFVERTNCLTLQLGALQRVHTELKAEAGRLEAGLQKAQKEAREARAEAEATAQACHERQRDIEHLDGEVERLSMELEEAREALVLALGRADEAEKALVWLGPGGAP
jgi:chromosome segregation ATPase